MPGLSLSSLARSTIFAPITPGDRVDMVVQRLSDSISLGMLGDGEQLPAQQELAASLGVSLVTLRDALGLLRQQGLVETKRGHGAGSFVKVNRRAAPARDRHRLERMSSHDIGDIADMQRAVFGQAARLAAERATQDFVVRLLAYVEHLQDTGNVRDRARLDGRFRIEVAAAAQSVRLARAEMQIEAEVSALRWLPLLTPEADEDISSAEAYHADVMDSHRALVDAISDSQASTAQQVAEQRVDRDLQRLLILHIQALSRNAR